MSARGRYSPALPTGRDLRRWVRVRTARTRSPWALVGDIYDAGLAIVVLGAMVVPYLGRLGTGSVPEGGGRGLSGVDPAWTALLLALVSLVLILEPLRRLGPLFLRPYEAAWWLDLPGDRRGLLEPVAWVEAAVALTVGSATGLLLAVVAASTPATAAGMVLFGAGCGGILLVLLLSAQLAGTDGRGARAALLGAATAALAADVVRLPFPRREGGLLLAVIGLLMCLVAALWWRRLRPRLVDLPDAHLLEAAARSRGAQVSVLSLDTRALGRLLSAPARRPAASSRLPLARLAGRLPRALRPVLCVAQADWLLLCRQPRRGLQLLVGLVIAVFPLLSDGVGAVSAVAFHLVGGWVSVLAVAEPARRAWFDGGADASWPAGPLLVRCGHLLMPTAVMTAWALSALTVELCARPSAPTSGEVLAALGLAALAGCGWAGAALRSGFRPTPDFSLGLVASPVGSVPPGVVEMLVSGPDAAALAGLPTALLALGTPPTAQLLGVQLAASGVVVAWGLLTGRRMRW
ncbi:DUF6297 family protein [Actinomyces ruminicola]|uniref:ABC-2 type transport system permease protein n=1 Tax=Actinomyces ruminicola TaxID=332524 RepID=A0A1G9Y631_9ACTO|nr:DUF6297 family protein [Actinomyces ruminicola]SDN04549.1 hypothetical protein SAMN04487766_11178 [Actinomyces ruminicola]